MIEEVDDEGACHTGERISALAITGVLPSHCQARVVVLASLRGRWCVCDGGMATDEAPRAKEETSCSVTIDDPYSRMEHK